jgi:hypothetical protein
MSSSNPSSRQTQVMGLEMPLYPEEVLYLAVWDYEVHVGTSREKRAWDNLVSLCDGNDDLAALPVVIVDHNQNWDAMMRELEMAIDRNMTLTARTRLFSIGQGEKDEATPAPLCFTQEAH